MLIQIHERMFSSVEAAKALQRVIAGTIDTDNGELPDGAARAIAADWQSPGTVLAALASGCAVDRDALCEDVAATGRLARPMWPVALECLATWVLNHA